MGAPEVCICVAAVIVAVLVLVLMLHQRHTYEPVTSTAAQQRDRLSREIGTSWEVIDALASQHLNVFSDAGDQERIVVRAGLEPHVPYDDSLGLTMQRSFPSLPSSCARKLATQHKTAMTRLPNVYAHALTDLTAKKARLGGEMSERFGMRPDTISKVLGSYEFMLDNGLLLKDGVPVLGQAEVNKRAQDVAHGQEMHGRAVQTILNQKSDEGVSHALQSMFPNIPRSRCDDLSRSYATMAMKVDNKPHVHHALAVALAARAALENGMYGDRLLSSKLNVKDAATVGHISAEALSHIEKMMHANEAEMPGSYQTTCLGNHCTFGFGAAPRTLAANEPGVRKAQRHLVQTARLDDRPIMTRFGHVHTSLHAQPLDAEESDLSKLYRLVDLGLTKDREWKGDESRSKAVAKLKKAMQGPAFGHTDASLGMTALDSDEAGFYATLRKVAHEMKKNDLQPPLSEGRRRNILASLRKKIGEVDRAQAEFGHSYSSLHAQPLNAPERDMVKALKLVSVQMNDADHDWAENESEQARSAIMSELKGMSSFGHSHTSLAATPISAKERELLKMYRLVDMQMNPADHDWPKEETAAARDAAAEKLRNSLSLRDMKRSEVSFGRVNLANAFTRQAPQSWKSAALQKMTERKFGHAHTSLEAKDLRSNGPAFHAALQKIKHQMNDPSKTWRANESEAARDAILRDLAAELAQKQVTQAQFGHAYSSLAGTPLNAEDRELLNMLMQVDMQMPGADHEWTEGETAAARRAIVSKMQEAGSNNAFGHAHTSLAGTRLDAEQRDLVQMFRLLDMQMNGADHSWTKEESDAARAAIMDKMKDSLLQGFGHAYSSLHASPVGRKQHELASLFKALKIDMDPPDHVWSETETEAARDAVVAKLKKELAGTSFGHAYSSLAATKLYAGDTEVEKALRKVQYDMSASDRTSGNESASRKALMNELREELKEKRDMQARFGHAYSSLQGTPLGQAETDLMRMLMNVEMQMKNSDHDWSASETDSARKAILSDLKQRLDRSFGHTYSSLAATNLGAEERDLLAMLKMVDMQMGEKDKVWTRAETNAARDTILDEMRNSRALSAFGHTYSSLAASPVDKMDHAMASMFKDVHVKMAKQMDGVKQRQADNTRNAAISAMQAQVGFGYDMSTHSRQPAKAEHILKGLPVPMVRMFTTDQKKLEAQLSECDTRLGLQPRCVKNALDMRAAVRAAVLVELHKRLSTRLKPHDMQRLLQVVEEVHKYV